MIDSITSEFLHAQTDLQIETLKQISIFVTSNALAAVDVVVFFLSSLDTIWWTHSPLKITDNWNSQRWQHKTYTHMRRVLICVAHILVSIVHILRYYEVMVVRCVCMRSSCRTLFIVRDLTIHGAYEYYIEWNDKQPISFLIFFGSVSVLYLK